MYQKLLLVVAIFTISNVLCASPASAQFWDALTNPQIDVTLNHPPGLGLKVNKIAFAPLQHPSSCADQLLDEIASDFVSSGAEVVDRQNLQAMLAEHRFNLSEYVDPAAKAQLGKLLGPAALIFVKVTRCASEQKSLKGEVWQDREGRSHRDFISRTTMYLKGSIKPVDLTTGVNYKGVQIDETVTRENKSRDECCAEFPSEFEVQDEALQRAVVQTHRMFFPWSETRKLYFFNDVPCGLQAAFRLVKAGDHDGALRASVENAATCVAGGKVKPKVLWHAQYNAGMAHFITGDFDTALGYFSKAAAGGGGQIVVESTAECRRAKQLAEEMRRVEERPALDVRPAAAKASAPAAAPASSDGVEVKLKKLKGMFDKGLITKDDYEKKKADLLKTF